MGTFLQINVTLTILFSFLVMICRLYELGSNRLEEANLWDLTVGVYFFTLIMLWVVYLISAVWM